MLSRGGGATRACVRAPAACGLGPARRAGRVDHGRPPCAAAEERQAQTQAEEEEMLAADYLSRDVSRQANYIAATTAPRSLEQQTLTRFVDGDTFGRTGKRVAAPGTPLHDLFVYQSYLYVAVGGLLAFNVIFPSDEPNVARFLGMWSTWLAVPGMRARDCSPGEKEALTILFLLIPLINVGIPFFVKSFGLVWVADVVAVAGMYAWKVGALPLPGAAAVAWTRPAMMPERAVCRTRATCPCRSSTCSTASLASSSGRKCRACLSSTGRGMLRREAFANKGGSPRST